MQGFPLLRLLLVGAALALLGIPVWMLTRERPTATAPAPQIVPEETGTFHVVLTTTTPAILRVMAANQPTASCEQPVMRFESDFKMNASEPEDIALFADFTDKTHPHAVRAEVSIGEKKLADSTFWGTGLVEDVVEIPSP